MLANLIAGLLVPLAGLLRDDIVVADVLDMAAAIAWVGEQPDRDDAQRERLLRIVIDGISH